MSKYPIGLLEEELKNKVAADWFAAYDTTRIIGKVDFCVAIPATELALFEAENALWAEAKAGVRKDIHESFVQLILTIGRARTFDAEHPPIFLGAFDAEKIAFLPYNAVMAVFSQNDFNWNVPPSNHESKEFTQLYALAKRTIATKSLLFNFESDEAELKKFIKDNFKTGRKDVSRIQIDKNNFTHIYRKWREAVLPHINAPWDTLKTKYSLYDRDFYLAELNVDDNGTTDLTDDTIAHDFYITFNAKEKNKYRVQRTNADELSFELTFGFKTEEGLNAYAEFWRRYKRPPRKDYWNYIVKRLDLLVPQDVRERKGAFFTPQKWVELSQEYLAMELGENWQDEYVIWDCCAGTGNMEAGLTNKYKVWASTLDQQDVDVMHERIKNGANLLDSHVFQFDFLNDSFDKLPDGLKDIVNDPDKRKKLVIYINPPYAEAGNAKQRSGTGENKVDVSVSHATYHRFLNEIGIAGRELFAQFFARIYKDIPNCFIGEFSKLKHLQAPNFKKFRGLFKARLCRGFIVPAKTFDNVDGEFPIGFFVWDLGHKELFREAICDVYSSKAEPICKKTLLSYDETQSINDWLIETRKRGGEHIGFLSARSHDIQHVLDIYIKNDKAQIKSPRGTWITTENVIEGAIYIASCHAIKANWLNDRDQFLYPNDRWKGDAIFKGNCLAYTLFAQANNIQSGFGINHWIPFTEDEVGAADCFASHFMSDFLAGKIAQKRDELFDKEISQPVISSEAQEVLNTGRELWRYYHSKPGVDVNASYYDIRKYFQGTKIMASGKEQMNSTSSDERYNELNGKIKSAMKRLAAKIEPKVYEYGFLKR